MKLLTKTTLYFLLAIIPLLAASGYFFFNQFNKQINEKADKELLYEEVQWVQYLEQATAGGGNFILRSPELLIYPADEPATGYPELTTSFGTKVKENTRIPFRQLFHVVNINGIPYQILIRKSQEQKLALVSNITTSMLFVFAGLLMATLIFNWIISKKLWQPFQLSLQKIRHLELQRMHDIHFEKTGTKEFNELNSSLNSMTNKIHTDYVTMKEFTEDAAHEMQTPLAVAQTKLELLLQDTTLKPAQGEAIVQAATALNRLSKLNQSLLLLAKIENHQYEAKSSTSLVDIIQKYLRQFDEIIKDKGIKIETHMAEDFSLMLHPFLADSLASNLLGNAIRYNKENGKIFISSTANEFCIQNTSDLPAIAAERLFKRFKTAANFPDRSTGLGLAFVKKIVDTNNLFISYQYKDGTHVFCLKKNDVLEKT